MLSSFCLACSSSLGLSWYLLKSWMDAMASMVGSCWEDMKPEVNKIKLRCSYTVELLRPAIKIFVLCGSCLPFEVIFYSV